MPSLETGHFYLAEIRTFLFGVDIGPANAQAQKAFQPSNPLRYNLTDMAGRPIRLPHLVARLLVDRTQRILCLTGLCLLVLQAGWSHAEYEQWLGDTFTRTLLPRRTKRP